MKQKSNDQFWIDESGVGIPYQRITAAERMMEAKSGQLVKRAKRVNEALVKFKEEINTISMEVYATFMKEKAVKTDRKGNFTWYNFDRSIRVEVSINEAIKFDDMTITAAKEKLDAFLTENIDSKLDFLKELIMDAFATSRGKLDTGKVLSLLKYKSKIKSPLFIEAMSLIEQGIRRPSSKTYYRIAEKDDQGEYKYIELNFSAI